MTSDVAVDDPLPQQQHGSPSGADSCAQKKINENNRRSNKPIMEKKRRARINNCLNELKTLILDATKKDPARHSKLEKADILEMTVKHLESVQRRGVVAAAESTAANKFEAGFAECTNEINRFPGLEPHVRARLMQHLGAYFDKEIGGGVGVPIPPAETPSVQLHLRDSGRRNAILVGATAGSAGGPVRLVPTRLPNGDIALVLPSATTTPPPALTTTPPRSDSSGTESPPAPDRPESGGGGRSAADDAYGRSELPLAAKHVRTDDERPDAERPWRPW